MVERLAFPMSEKVNMRKNPSESLRSFPISSLASKNSSFVLTRQNLSVNPNMAGGARKTERAGPKRGRGSCKGSKADAKRESHKARRVNARRAGRQDFMDSEG